MTPKKRRYHCVVLGRFQHISQQGFTRLSVNSIFSILVLSNSLKIINKENSQSKYSTIIESVNNRSFITEKNQYTGDQPQLFWPPVIVMVLSNLITNTVIKKSSKRSPFKNFLSRPERHPLMSDETPCHQEDSSFHSATSEYRVEVCWSMSKAIYGRLPVSACDVMKEK